MFVLFIHIARGASPQYSFCDVPRPFHAPVPGGKPPPKLPPVRKPTKDAGDDAIFEPARPAGNRLASFGIGGSPSRDEEETLREWIAFCFDLGNYFVDVLRDCYNVVELDEFQFGFGASHDHRREHKSLRAIVKTPTDRSSPPHARKGSNCVRCCRLTGEPSIRSGLTVLPSSSSSR
jgi:hypothetical protein